MLKLLILLNITSIILTSQEITFDVFDNINNKSIDFDSLHISNEEYEIDTTLESTNLIDINNFLSITEIKQHDYLDVRLANNKINVVSSEKIENVIIYDLFGQEIYKKGLDSSHYQVEINLENNSLHYAISIKTKNGIYKSKIMNTTNVKMSNENLMPETNRWIITVYKFGFFNETFEFVDIPSKLHLKFKLKKILLTMKCDLKFEKIHYEHTVARWDYGLVEWVYHTEFFEKDTVFRFNFIQDIFSKSDTYWRYYLSYDFDDKQDYGNRVVINNETYFCYFDIENEKDTSTFIYKYLKGESSEVKTFNLNIYNCNEKLKDIYNRITNSTTFSINELNANFAIEYDGNSQIDDNWYGYYNGNYTILSGTVTFEIAEYY